MIYFTSDAHFGHKNVIKYCNRPFSSLDEMHTALIANWNSVVKPNDIVYVLGDFSFLGISETAAILQQLNGTKVLIWGNHDSKSRTALMRAGFSAVLEEAKIRLSKDIVVKLSHFPYAPSWFEQWRKGFKANHLYLRPKKESGWLVHGHVHNAYKIREKSKQLNVGVDVHNFTPVSSDYIIATIMKAEGHPRDNE